MGSSPASALGLLIEVYVDADPAVWAARPEAVATVRPLRVGWLAHDRRRFHAAV